MAYDTQELKDQALSAIEENQLYFISDVVAFLPCSSSTFYLHELEKSEAIKKALSQNKINAKIEMRKKWLKSDNATMQMGLMKLLSEDEELKKLAMEYKEHSGGIKINRIERTIIDPKENE